MMELRYLKGTFSGILGSSIIPSLSKELWNISRNSGTITKIQDISKNWISCWKVFPGTQKPFPEKLSLEPLSINKRVLFGTSELF